MKGNSIIFKLMLIMAVVAAILSVMASLYINNRVERDIAYHIEEEAEILTDALNFAVTPLLESGDIEVLGEVIDGFNEYDLVRSVRIHQPDGTVIYSTTNGEIGQVITASPITVVAQNPLDGSVLVNKGEDSYVSVAPLICGHEDKLVETADAVLYVELDFNYSDFIGQAIKNDLRSVFAIIGVVFLVIFYVFVNRILGKPLHKLVSAANEISQNNYSHRVEIDEDSELNVLAVAFNKMAENIEHDAKNLEKSRVLAERASETRLEFLAKMSHEIRTPLNAIVGFSDVLSEEIDNPTQRESLDVIVSSSNHLMNLVNEILDIAKLENEKMTLESQPFSIRTLLGDVKNMFHLAAQDKDIDLNIEVDVNVPTMYLGDAHRIRQILINLVGNALKFTEEGTIEIIVEFDAPNTVIEVIDTGIGIPEEKQRRIFDAYAQSDASISSMYGGTGLGLAISKRIASMMKGKIELKSQVGRGSTFTVTLMLDQMHVGAKTGSQMVERWIYADTSLEDIVKEVLEGLPERMATIEEKATIRDLDQLRFHVHSLKGVSGNFSIVEIYELALALDTYLHEDEIDYREVEDYIYRMKETMRKIPSGFVVPDKAVPVDAVDGDFRILLAEDVPANQLLIRQMLKNFPVEIDTVDDGAKAIEKLEANKYDCVLLDIQMPILSGEDVLKWIRSSDKVTQAYIIALTANAFKEDMDKYLSLGAHYFLAKPVKKELLRDKIVELINLKGEGKTI